MLAEIRNLATLFHNKFMAGESAVATLAQSDDLETDMEEGSSHKETSLDLQTSPAGAATPNTQVDPLRKSGRLRHK